MHNNISNILNINDITNDKSDTLHDKTAVNGYGYTSDTPGTSNTNQIIVPKTLNNAIPVKLINFFFG